MKVLVTGGAKGLGKAICTVFAENGIDVVINYNHSEAEAKQLVKDLQSKNVNVTAIKCDVSSETDVKEMINQIDELDYIVNNAAISLDNELWNKSAEEFNKVLTVNLTGPFLITKYAITKMKKGSIINIGSTNAINTYYMQSADYDASKAGLISLTHNFAKYLYDIRVNCICPDWIDTPMNNNMDPEYRKTINFLDPEKVAELVYKVAINPQITDQIIKISGEQK